MQYLATEIVAPGGPSAPVWAFFTAISLALIGVLAQQISAKRTANDAKIEAAKAAKNSQKAQANTEALSNGFAESVGTKLDRIQRSQDSLGKAFREHLEWHLDNSARKD